MFIKYFLEIIIIILDRLDIIISFKWIKSIFGDKRQIFIDYCTDKRSWSIVSEIYFRCIEYCDKILNRGPHKTVNSVPIKL